MKHKLKMFAVIVAAFIPISAGLMSFGISPAHAQSGEAGAYCYIDPNTTNLACLNA